MPNNRLVRCLRRKIDSLVSINNWGLKQIWNISEKRLQRYVNNVFINRTNFKSRRALRYEHLEPG